jgi:very-short-patch-repair endonuclease
VQRKKPLTRKTPLRTKHPLRAKQPLRAKAAIRPAADTDAVWALLAARPGPPFVRNAKLGTVVADFYCPAAQLAVLIGEPERTAILQAAGFRVIAAEAGEAPQNVLDAVDEAFAPRLVSR